MVDGKAFTPHLTVAKLSKAPRKKAPRKLPEVRYLTGGRLRPRQRAKISVLVPSGLGTIRALSGSQ